MLESHTEEYDTIYQTRVEEKCQQIVRKNLNYCLSPFRSELERLQKTLRKYTKMLADMADVEDLTSLEESVNSF